MESSVLILGDATFCDAAVAEILSEVSPHLSLFSFRTSAELTEWEAPDDVTVALSIIIPSADESLDDMVDTVLRSASSREPHVLILTSRPYLTDLSRALDMRAVHGVIAAPWTPGNLAAYVKAQVSRWQRRHPQPSAAEIPSVPMGSDLLRHLELPIEDATNELLAAVEDALGPRPRIQLSEGVRITHESLDIDQVYIVVSGQVQLMMRSESAGTVLLNHESTGPVVGLMALADRHRSLVTARTTTPVEMVQLTLEQLDRALALNPRVGAVLTALTIRALTARLRHAQRDRVEKAELTSQLRSTLSELEQARSDLISQARLATLGELAAGIAHELNNPVAAVARSAEHLVEDLPRLLANDPIALEVLERARTRERLDAAEERAVRRDISRVVKDPVLVRRLVAAGVTSADQAKRLTKRRGAQDLERVEMAAGVGASLHALQLASDHIANLVAGLRQHARPDDGQERGHDPVVVAETVDAALQLVGHRLRNIETTVHVAPGLPRILGNPTELAQVWTNLFANAADALTEQGSVNVNVDSVAAQATQWIRVRVCDNGPGIPEELRQHIFEPRFTTKHGVVRFGLGLGLNIARSIVEGHDGTISVTSEPGNTCFEVRFPVVEET